MRKEGNMARWARWGLYAVLAVATAPSTALGQAAGGSRIAIIDFQAVMKADPQFAGAEQTFTKEMEARRKEVEKLQTSFDSAMTDYQKTSVVLSPSAKATREGLLRTMQQTLQQRASEFQNQVQQRESELIGPIEKRLRSIVDGYRAEKNIGIIFDIGPASNGLIAVDPALDITSAVLARLKSGQ